MRCFVILSLLTFGFLPVRSQQVATTDSFTVRIVADRLSDPWEVTFGPDSSLWVTEAKGYRVLRISPADGTKQVLLDLSGERDFPRYDRISDATDGGKPWPQAGLMGLALHPDLTGAAPFVYLAYIYRFAGADKQGTGCLDAQGGCFFSTRIVRYRYDVNRQTLDKPEIVADSLPGSNDHNGGRLLIAPVGGKQYLFYSIGDMGAGQFDNAGRFNRAQDTTSYEGKVLRFNLAPDSTARINAWIPVDNPFHNAIFTWGHRNPQGLATASFGASSFIYTAEHGPFSDDEVNLLEMGKNYGHPLVIGYNDGNYNGLAAGVTNHTNLPGTWHTAYPSIKTETGNVKQIGAGYRNPLYSFYATDNKTLKALFDKEKRGQGGDWKAEAPSSVQVYTSDLIPGWKNSLLITTLKGGKLIRLKLDSTGKKIVGKPVNYFRGPVRYRDLAISPDGSRIYVALDSTSVSSGPSEENPQAIAYRGVILEYRYVPRGSGQSSGSSTGSSSGSSNQSSANSSVPLSGSSRSGSGHAVLVIDNADGRKHE